METYENHEYKLLQGITDLYGGVDMRDVLLLSCQHLLGPQLRMFELFLRAGLKPENCIIAGKNYSTNHGVRKDLERLGCVVAPWSEGFEAQVAFDDWFARRLDEFLTVELMMRDMRSIRMIIVLDDGGHMHEAAVKFFGRDPRLAGVEQTSSGYNRIMTTGIAFENEHMVARTPYKQFEEAPYIGICGMSRILAHLRARGKTDPNILVLGLGTIGRQIAGRLFVLEKKRGVAADIHFDDDDHKNIRLRDFGANHLLVADGRIIGHADAMARLSEFDVIIGATGYPSIPEGDLDRLHPEVSLISMSSSDREFPALRFRKPGDLVHSDCYNGKRCLVNAGFPITFSGVRHEVRPIEIELTMAQLYACVLDLAGKGKVANLPNLSLALAQAHDIWQAEC